MSGAPDQIQRLVETTNREFGKIDILVNNAATNIAQEPVLADRRRQVRQDGGGQPEERLSPDPGDCARHVRARLGLDHQYRLDLGVRPQYHGMLYSMTKAALIMMTQSYALELGPRGVRVNAIAPGMIQTVLSEYYWKDDAKREKIIEEQPIKHLGQPEEIAEIALLLASDRGSYITGQTMIVDGGRLLP